MTILLITVVKSINNNDYMYILFDDYY